MAKSPILKNRGTIEQEIAKEVKGIIKAFFIDTETDEDKNPVSLGLTRDSESRGWFLDYGSDRENIKRLLAAMDVPGGENGSMYESSQALRQLFNIEKEFKIKMTENMTEAYQTFNEKQKKAFIDKYTKLYKEYMIGPSEFVKMIEDANGGSMDGAVLAAYNAKFDKRAIANWFKNYKGPKAVSKAKAKDFLSHMQDMFYPIVKELDNLYYDPDNKHGTKGSVGAGILTQENIARLLNISTGKAHTSQADSETLKKINDSDKEPLKRFNRIVGEAWKKHAQKEGIKSRYTESGKYFSQTYKDFVQELQKIYENQTPKHANEDEDKFVDRILRLYYSQFPSSSKTTTKAKTVSANVKSKTKEKINDIATKIYKELQKKNDSKSYADSFSGKNSAAKILQRNGISEASANEISRYGAGSVDKTDKDMYGFEGGSLGSIVQEIQNRVEDLGGSLSYKIDGNQIHFFVIPENGEVKDVKTFDIALANENSKMKVGKRYIQNMLELDTKTNLDHTILAHTVQEKQALNVLGSLHGIDSLEELGNKTLGYRSKKAIMNVSSTPATSIDKEVNDMVESISGGPSNVISQGLVSFEKLGYSLNKAFKFLIDESTHDALSWNDLMKHPTFKKDFGLVLNAILAGVGDILLASAPEDSLVHQMMSNEDFVGEIEGLRDKGFSFNIEGLKPQAFAKMMGSLSGGTKIIAGTTFWNPSDRKATQRLRLAELQNKKIKKGRENLFARKEGLALGIDYKTAEFQQRIGAEITEDELQKYFSESFPGLDLEDAVIIPESLAKKMVFTIDDTAKLVETGIKMWSENAQGYTARVVNDEQFKAFKKKAGLSSDVEYLTGKKKLEAKTLGTTFGGRLRAIGAKVGFERLAEAIQHNEELSKIFEVDKKNKLILDISSYDNKQGIYIGRDNKPLFTGSIDNQKQQFLKLYDSVEELGKMLLGKKYDPRVYGGYLGPANTAYYEDASGAIDEELASVSGRVKYDAKARDAKKRKLEAYRNIIVGSGVDEKSYNDYYNSEMQRINADSSLRARAQGKLDIIQQALEANASGRNLSGNTIEIVTDLTKTVEELADNQILISEILTDYNEEDIRGENARQDIWEQTLEGRVEAILKKKGWTSANIKISGVHADTQGFGYWDDAGKYHAFNNRTNNVYLPYLEGHFSNPSFVQDRSRRFLSDLKTGKDPSESLQKLQSDLKYARYDKHSAIKKEAELSRVGASAFNNVVGDLNVEAGTIQMSENYLRSFLTYGELDEYRKTEDKNEAIEHLANIREINKQYSLMYQAQVGYNDKLDSILTETVNDPIKQHEKLVQLIIDAVKSDQLELIGESARYPFIQGKDLQHVAIKIDKTGRLGDGAIAVPKSLSFMERWILMEIKTALLLLLLRVNLPMLKLKRTLIILKKRYKR